MRAKACCVTLFLLSTVITTKAANRYWIGSVLSNFNNILNWSSTSGGLPGASVPTAGDAAIFDNGGTGNCNIDAAVNIASLTVNTGYTGTIIQNNNTIAIAGAASLAAGAFTGGTANITISGIFTNSGTAFTSTSAILELRANAAFTGGSFTHNNGTVRFNGSGSATISGTSPTFYILEFVGKGNTYTLSSTGNITVTNSLNLTGSLFYNLATGAIDVQGDINSSNTATGCGGDALITFTGTGTQNFIGSTVAGAGALPQLTINKPSGSLNLSNYPSVSNNFTYTSGTVSAGTSTFFFTHGNVGAYSVSGNISLNNIQFYVNTSLLTVTITNLSAAGNLTLAGAGNLVINTGNINLSGDLILTNTATSGGGSATIVLNGSGAQTIDGTAITQNQTRLPALNIAKPAGTLTLSGNISFASGVTYTSGTVNPGTSTCYVVNTLTMTGTFSLYNLTISGPTNITLTVASGSTITTTNTLDLENGANYITISTGTIAAQGNIIDNNSSTSGGGTATILINGNGAQTLTSTGIIYQGNLPGVTINKPSGTLTFPALITVRGNWTYLAGTCDVTTNASTVVFGNTLNISGNQPLNNIVFDGSGNYTYNLSGATLAVSGNMTLSGTGNLILNNGNINLNGNLLLTNTATAGTGTTNIAFTSASNQAIISSLAINQCNLPAITINKPSGTLTLPALITVRGNWTYISGTMDGSTNNSTVAFANTLTLTGSHSLNNVNLEGNFNNTYTVSTGSVLTVTGSLTTSGSSYVVLSTPVNGATAIQAKGDIVLNNTSVSSGGLGGLLINGTGAQTFTGNIAAGQGRLPYVTIQKPSGTLTMSGTISVSRDWSYLSGTVNPSTSTVVFGGNNLAVSSSGMSFNHVTIMSNTATLGNSLSLLGNLSISGTGVLAPGANSITIGGNWVNWGTAGFTEATSTVSFNGSSVQTLTTPGGENFNALTVSNTGSGIQLLNDVTTATTLNMTQGNIDLNGNNMTLGASAATPGTLVRTQGAVIGTGAFRRWFNTSLVPDLSGAGLFPMGTTTSYSPLYVTAPTTAPTTGGTIAITYTNAITNSTVSIPDGAATVLTRKDLNWAVTTANGLAGGTYNLDAQGNNFGTIGDVADLRLTLAAAVIGSVGVNAGTTSTPQINRVGLTLANLSNTFYVGSVSANSPLPITLISFSATAASGKVRLDWTTANETNNSFFTMERSANTADWTDILNVSGRGNTTGESKYTISDEQPLSGLSYYRLRQTDLDGKQTFSAIKTVNIAVLSGAKAYPNPASGYLIIDDLAPNSSVSLLSCSGQRLNIPMTRQGNKMTLYLSTIPKGAYFVQIATETSQKMITVLKEQ